MRESRLNRVKEREKEESESEEIEKQKLVEIKERIGSLRKKTEFPGVRGGGCGRKQKV